MLKNNIELKVERKSEDYRIHNHIYYTVTFDVKNSKYALTTSERNNQFTDEFYSLQDLVKHLFEDSISFKSQVNIDYVENVEISGTLEGSPEDFFYLEFKDKETGLLLQSIDKAILERFSVHMNDNYHTKVLSYDFRNVDTNIADGREITIDYSGNVLTNKECDLLSDDVEYIYKEYKKATNPGYVYNKLNKADIIWRN